MIRYQFLLRRVHERFGKYRRIPAGTYRVYLQGTTVREEKTGKDSEETDIIPDYKEVLHGTSKFTSPETSGLAVEVQSGGKQTDIYGRKAINVYFVKTGEIAERKNRKLAV